jgi:16S rRNA G966 N2-methylase RsmD
MCKYDILNDDGIIVAETDESDIVDDVVGDFFKYDERKYGRVRIHFFRKAR